MSQSKEHDRPNMIGRTTDGYVETELHEKNFHTSPGNMSFNPYPKHMDEPYEPKVEKKMDNEQHEKTFHNSPGNMYLNPFPKHMDEPYEPKVEKEMNKDMDGPFVSSSYPKAYFEDNPYKETPKN